MKQKLAWLGIIAILAVFAALIYCTVTGASAGTIMAFMFCLIMIPILIHGMIMFSKFTNHNNDSDNIEKKDRD